MTILQVVTNSQRFFEVLLQKPKLVIVTMLIIFITALSFLPKIIKDTRGDAFLAPDNPALIYRDKVKKQFGLNDPVVIAIKNIGENGIYNPATLGFIDQLTQKLMALKNVDDARVFSLSTEKNIIGTNEGMEVHEFYDPYPDTQEQANLVKKAIEDFPLYNGSIVSKDGQVALIVAELINPDISSATYQAVFTIANSDLAVFKSNNNQPLEVHVAGEGAIAGYLGDYIDRDMQILNPLAGLIIFITIIVGFRRFVTGLLGLIMIATTVLSTMGLMAASGTPFFVITNALPVILIGIAVADSIHIFSHYFELQATHPEKRGAELVIDTMSEMWRPVTLTSLTTMAGFMGLYFAAYMPPFKYFGLFAAIGVGFAWVYSLTLLPAILCLVKPRGSEKFLANFHKVGEKKQDLLTVLITRFGMLSVRHSGITVCIGLIVIGVGLFASSKLIIDEDRIKTFNPDELIYKSDRVMNKHTNGTNNLDIIIETPNKEDLFKPENLDKIEALQEFALTYVHVKSATSIVDYLKQMNRALNNGGREAYKLPDEKNLAAQYFLLYSASGDPTDFEEEVDYDYRLANVRLVLDTGSYQDNKELVEQLQEYVDKNFNGPDIQATLTGRVTVDYFWIRDLGKSHFASLSIALLLVWLASTLLFRSVLAGIYTLIPVAVSLLFVYSAMVIWRIPLGIGTSMFASVAIGLGVDFSIHTIDRLRSLFAASVAIENNKKGGEESSQTAFSQNLLNLYPGTGRALLLNFLVVACGFGVLIVSKVVPLNDFGSIVVVSVTGSFIGSMSLLPALIKIFKPNFITQPVLKTNATSLARLLSGVIIVGVLFSFAFYAKNVDANANSSYLEDADLLVKKINDVDEGGHVTRSLSMKLTDRHGKVRERETIMYQKYYDFEKRTLMIYREPSNVKGTAFLTYDYPDIEKDDDQWLYLPAMRKARRISSSNRGDYFLGTDFTYEDIKKEGKLEVSDYAFKTLGETKLNGAEVFHVEAIPKTNKIADELGYSRTEFWVDKSNWIIVKNVYWDVKGNLLKTLTINDVKIVDGIWSRHKLTIKNHKTGHQTQFDFSEIDYKSTIADDIFSNRALARR